MICSNILIFSSTIIGSPINDVHSLESSNKRKSMQLKRNSGQEYVSARGKHVKGRSVSRLSKCRNDCKSQVTYEDQVRNFDSHYSGGSYKHRCDSISSLIQIKAKKVSKGNTSKLRKYSVEYFLITDTGQVQVCQKCFLNTCGETYAFVHNVAEKMWQALCKSMRRDSRGRHRPKNKTSDEKISEMKQHLGKFPFYESHYTRSHTSQKYFPIELDIPKMYKLYCDETAEPLSKKMYTKACKMYMKDDKIKFKHPQLECCHKCDEYQTLIKYESDATKKQQLEEEKNSHQDMARLAYSEKKKDKETAKESNGSLVMCSFDLEQCLPTPLLHTPVSFYKRKLWVYNLTVSSSCKNTECYMRHEATANRGNNEIASCLEKSISRLPPSVTHATYWSDCCSGQNKNKIVAGMFTSLVANHPTLQVIDHKFLVPGHTHMECDSDHAIIEKAKKSGSTKIQHPDDWYALVRQVKTTKPFEVIEMKQQDFYDYETLYSKAYVMRHKNVAKQTFYWKDVRWMRYTKAQGILYYKNNFSEDEPFLELNIRRRGKSNFKLDSKRILKYKQPVCINEEKKKDLLDILHLLSPDVRDFYINLQTDKTIANFDPDLGIFNEDLTKDDGVVSSNVSENVEEVPYFHQLKTLKVSN